MANHLDWFTSFKNNPHYQTLSSHPIAYFCAEFALSHDLPVYAGGLGVLAADIVKEAHDREFPMIGVGLYYYEGYSCKTEIVQGELTETCQITHPEQIGLEPVNNANGERITVSVPMMGKNVKAQAWVWKAGSVPVYFLDSNIELNDPNDRKITNRLYTSDQQMRLKQEMILGIGGIRLLKTLGITPSVYHMNEGHSAFLVLEVAHNLMKEKGLNFVKAIDAAKHQTVFTNHTLVAAGHDVYVNDLVSLMFDQYALEMQIPVNDIVNLGLVRESDTFSMTMLSLRHATMINAVSKLHAQRANEIWTNHPMLSITNGIHVPTWDKLKNPTDGPTLWQQHLERKRILLAYIKDQTGNEWNENELIIGWARRIVNYKRPLALFEDLAAFKAIAQNSEKPVKIVFAGLPHPDDRIGVEMLNQILRMAAGEFNGTVVYLKDYTIDLGAMLTSGCDVWLNTPIVGYEACGTSGMKAALNGVLPMTTPDGWAAEVDLDDIGYSLTSDNIKNSLLDTLRDYIVPGYYSRDENNFPQLWLTKTLSARKLMLERFSATRMLKHYADNMYLRVLDNKEQPATTVES